MGKMSPDWKLADRRQSAREVYWDDMRGLSMRASGIDEAIEVATRVRITDEILNATGLPKIVAKAVVIAAFEAAGFEVVE